MKVEIVPDGNPEAIRVRRALNSFNGELTVV